MAADRAGEPDIKRMGRKTMEEKRDLSILDELGIGEELLAYVTSKGVLSREELVRYALNMRAYGKTDEQIRADFDALEECYRREDAKLDPLFCAVPASSFTEQVRGFVWKPYLPEGEFTVLMAPGGTGKTFFVCAVAAALSRGLPLPGESEGRGREKVLLISAEDEGSVLRGRLEKCGAELENVMVLDSRASQGLCFSEEFEDFRQAVLAYRPRLVVVDPWHAFLGVHADMNRANTVRPLFQRLSNLCKECGCAMLLLAHVNKRLQTENINNAAMGSADLVNAARSVLYLLRDPEDRDCRVAVHSKANYAAEGQSLKLRIEDGGAFFAGFSDVTKEEVESANRQHRSLRELRHAAAERSDADQFLIARLLDKANPFAPVRLSYESMLREYGPMVFGGRQPKRALEACRDALEREGLYLRTGVQIQREGKKYNGFTLYPLAGEAEQRSLFDAT